MGQTLAIKLKFIRFLWNWMQWRKMCVCATFMSRMHLSRRNNMEKLIVFMQSFPKYGKIYLFNLFIKIEVKIICLNLVEHVKARNSYFSNHFRETSKCVQDSLRQLWKSLQKAIESLSLYGRQVNVVWMRCVQSFH